MLPVVQDDFYVHRIVLAWRAFDLRRLTGDAHAQTLLRQSVRYCVNSEKSRVRQDRPEPRIRSVLPRLLDEHRLHDAKLGSARLDDARIEELSATVFSAGREPAAGAVAAALAEGADPTAIGEAISLAANRLLLHDPGRQDDAGPDKPRGTVHGASVGVHASDAANAWRNVARVGGSRNAIASLIVGAYHTAGQSEQVRSAPFHQEAAAAVEEKGGKALLRAADEAITRGDQAGASAVIERYGALGHPSQPVFDLLIRYAVSEDGALHAEKYFRTVVEEFSQTRSAFQWRHLTALARVTASEHGFPAPGVDEARRLLRGCTEDHQRIKNEPDRGWEEVTIPISKGECFFQILNTLDEIGYDAEWQVRSRPRTPRSDSRN